MGLEITTHSDDTGRHRQTQAGMLSHDVMHTTVVLTCSKPFPKHSKGIRQTPHPMKQTQAKLQCVSNKHCLHMTSTGEADRHHLLDPDKRFRVAGHLRTAGSACPHVPLSVQTWRHQPNTFLFVCLYQLQQHLPHQLLYLAWVACIMHAYDGWNAMRKLTSGLASCTLCSANEYSLHMVRVAFCTCSFELHMLHEAHNRRHQEDCICQLVHAIHDAGELQNLCITRLQPFGDCPSCTSAAQNMQDPVRMPVHLCTTGAYLFTV